MEDLNDLIKELDTLIVNIKSSHNADYIRHRMKRFKELIRSLMEEARINRIDIKTKISYYQEQYTNFKGPLVYPETHPDVMKTDESLSVAKLTQGADIDRMDRIINQTETIKQIGSQTAHQIGQNNEKLMKVEEGLDQVESNIKLAKRELHSFVRRIATDKITICLTCILFSTIIGLVIYKIINP